MKTDRRRIEFAPPDITEAEISEVVDVLRSGWITTGPKTKEFERRLREYIGASGGVCCLGSQTACAEMALRLLGVGPGDEVIVPAYTYTASASVVCHVGARLILVDSKNGSYEMDYDKLEETITPKTKAIIPVDLAGIPCDYERIFDIVSKKAHMFAPGNALQEAMGRIAICADDAHALGASWHGKKLGAIADFSSFSFHAVKNLTTAEGGCLAWNEIPGIDSEQIYRNLQLLSLHGQSKDALSKTQAGAWEYDVIGTWYKCNMTDLQAALGLAQLSRYGDLLSRRREIIEYYNKELDNFNISPLNHFASDYVSSGHLYLCRIPGFGVRERNDLIAKLANLGIATNVHYKPLPMHTAYKSLGFNVSDYPCAFKYYENEITLPLHTQLSDLDLKHIVDMLKRCLG